MTLLVDPATTTVAPVTSTKSARTRRQHPLFDQGNFLVVHGPGPTELLEEDDGDGQYIPCRLLSVGNDRTTYVLPAYPAVQSLVTLIQQVLNNGVDVLWVSGKSRSLDEDIESELLTEIHRRARSTNDTPLTVVPYERTERFHRWADQLDGQVQVFGDSPQWCAQFNDKGLLHPHISRSQHFQLADRVPELPVVEGFTCDTLTDLYKAYRTLQSQDISDVYLKPCRASAGNGIQQITSIDHLAGYDFPFGPVVLERTVQRDCDNRGDPLPSLSMRYYDGHVLNVTDQIIINHAASGNLAPSRVVDSDLVETLRQLGQSILTATGAQGAGGFNFLLENGKPILIDPNLGRFNGGHFGYFFWQTYAPQLPHYCWWKVRDLSALRRPIGNLWKELSQSGLAFDPSRPEQGGVFPFCYLQGIIGLLIALGNSPEQVDELKRRTDLILWS